MRQFARAIPLMMDNRSAALSPTLGQYIDFSKRPGESDADYKKRLDEIDKHAEDLKNRYNKALADDLREESKNTEDPFAEAKAELADAVQRGDQEAGAALTLIRQEEYRKRNENLSLPRLNQRYQQMLDDNKRLLAENLASYGLPTTWPEAVKAFNEGKGNWALTFSGTTGPTFPRMKAEEWRVALIQALENRDTDRAESLLANAKAAAQQAIGTGFQAAGTLGTLGQLRGFGRALYSLTASAPKIAAVTSPALVSSAQAGLWMKAGGARIYGQVRNPATGLWHKIIPESFARAVTDPRSLSLSELREVIAFARTANDQTVARLNLVARLTSEFARREAAGAMWHFPVPAEEVAEAVGAQTIGKYRAGVPLLTPPAAPPIIYRPAVPMPPVPSPGAPGFKFQPVPGGWKVLSAPARTTIGTPMVIIRPTLRATMPGAPLILPGAQLPTGGPNIRPTPGGWLVPVTPQQPVATPVLTPPSTPPIIYRPTVPVPGAPPVAPGAPLPPGVKLQPVPGGFKILPYRMGQTLPPAQECSTQLRALLDQIIALENAANDQLRSGNDAAATAIRTQADALRKTRANLQTWCDQFLAPLAHDIDVNALGYGAAGLVGVGVLGAVLGLW